jgi:hypothetical protein
LSTTCCRASRARLPPIAGRWASLVPGFFGIPFVPIPGTPAQTLTEHWDSSAWTIVRSADSNAGENILDSVACTAASSCWAVGIDNNGSGAYDALIEHYDGSAWSVVSAADPSQQLNELDGAWCNADGVCRAAGIQRATAATQTLVERRTATGWAVSPSENVSPSQPDQLWGVACAAAAECWAVGYSTDAGGVNHTLIEGTGTAPPPAVPDVAPLLTTAAAMAAAAIRRGRPMRSPKRSSTLPRDTVSVRVTGP